MPTTVDPSAPPATPPPEDGYITEDTQQPEGQKYLVLDVPDFKNEGTFHSYLCLGSASQWFQDNNGRDPSKYGQQLANMVSGFCDDDRSQLASAGPPPVHATRSTFDNFDPTCAPQQGVDDDGSGEVASPTEFPPPQGSSPAPGSGTTSTPPAGSTLNPMQQESALLQLKGGWRDHSDGNRITTTYGDKVEVIRGNYKLLVLGRQDWPDGPNATSTSTSGTQEVAAPVPTQVAGWDISGGLATSNPQDLLYGSPANVNDRNSAWPPPPAQYAGQAALMTQYSWEQNSDGNWGWTRITQTGQIAPPNNAVNQNLGNGVSISYTWVDQLFEYVGSPPPATSTSGGGSQNPDQFVAGAKPYPVQSMYSKAWASSIVEEQNASGSMSVTTNVGSMDTSNNNGVLTVNTTAGQQSIENTFGNWDLAAKSATVSLAITAASAVITAAVEPAMPNQVDAAGVPTDAATGTVQATPTTIDPNTGEIIPGNAYAPGPGDNYFYSAQSWGKEAVGGIGKLGPMGYGLVSTFVKPITMALSENTTILGPASRTINTFGTNSTTHWTLGGLSEMDLTAGSRSTTLLTAGVASEANICLGAVAKIKVALVSSEFDIAVMSTNKTTFSATALTTDLTTRTITQVPAVNLVYLALTQNGVADTHACVNRAHLTSLNSIGGLLHALF